jgi:hypothetical protein
MCSIQQKGFIDLCMKGEYLLEDIDDFIDEWHEGEFEEELHDFLGMSREEYALWAAKPHILPYIVKARMQHLDIQDILRD